MFEIAQWFYIQVDRGMLKKGGRSATIVPDGVLFVRAWARSDGGQNRSCGMQKLPSGKAAD